MLQETDGRISTWFQELFIQLQIEAELSRNGQFDCFDVQMNVPIKGVDSNSEIADLIVHKFNITEIYLIKPAHFSEGELNVCTKIRLEKLIRDYQKSVQNDVRYGNEVFYYISPCLMDPERVLIYWCLGDGIVYYQLGSQTEFFDKCSIIYFTSVCYFAVMLYLKKQKISERSLI